MTIESAIAEIENAGMKIGNLYKGTDGIWRCALDNIKLNMLYATIQGDSPEDAIRRAFEHTKAPATKITDPFAI